MSLRRKPTTSDDAINFKEGVLPVKADSMELLKSEIAELRTQLKSTLNQAVNAETKSVQPATPLVPLDAHMSTHHRTPRNHSGKHMGTHHKSLEMAHRHPGYHRMEHNSHLGAEIMRSPLISADANLVPASSEIHKTVMQKLDFLEKKLETRKSASAPKPVSVAAAATPCPQSDKVMEKLEVLESKLESQRTSAHTKDVHLDADLALKVMSKIDALEQKLNTKPVTTDAQAMKSVMTKLNLLESKLTDTTSMPTTSDAQAMNSVMTKLNILESKLTDNKMSVSSELDEIKMQVHSKLDQLDKKVRTSMPVVTHEAYLQEKARLEKLLKMRAQLK